MTMLWPHTRTAVVFGKHADLQHLPCLCRTAANN